MKKDNMKKTILSLTLLLSITLSFIGCGKNEKEIQLSSDVKQELKDQEKNAVKLVKAKELEFGDSKYLPIGWKDDENIIVTEGDKTKDGFIDIDTNHMDNISVYNINIKTSKVSKLNTISDAICGDVGEKNLSGNFLYIKDNKLYMYNVKDNTQKQIYDLSEVIKEIKESSRNDIMRNNKVLDKVHPGFIKGNDRYVSVIYSIYNQQNCKIKIIDLQTGKVTGSSWFSGFFPGIDYPEAEFRLAYSKMKNAFYMSSFNSDAIYEYRMDNSSTLRKIKNASGQIFGISEDGRELYLSSNYKNKKKIITKYDIEKDKLTEILSDNMRGPVKNQISVYMGVSLNQNKNIISYSIKNVIFDSSYKYASKIQDTSFIGNFDGNTIKNPKIFPTEQIDNQNSFNYILFGPKGDKVLYTIYYFDFKENKIKINKVKSFIYEINK